MNQEVQLSESQIRSAVISLRQAGEKVRADRKLVNRLLRRIGADSWPESNFADKKKKQR